MAIYAQNEGAHFLYQAKIIGKLKNKPEIINYWEIAILHFLHHQVKVVVGTCSIPPMGLGRAPLPNGHKYRPPLVAKPCILPLSIVYTKI